MDTQNGTMMLNKESSQFLLKQPEPVTENLSKMLDMDEEMDVAVWQDMTDNMKLWNELSDLEAFERIGQIRERVKMEMTKSNQV